MAKDKSKLFILGGFAAILAGVFVLTFAITSESKEILFVLEALSGGSMKTS